MNDEILNAINELESRGYTAAKGLRTIAEKTEDTWLNGLATKFYQDGPVPVAKVVEMLIAAGKIIPDTTDRWWPSAMEKLASLDRRGYSYQDNPPRLVTRHAETGNVCSQEIAAPTQEALDNAIRAIQTEMETKKKTTRRIKCAQQEVDSE